MAIKSKKLIKILLSCILVLLTIVCLYLIFGARQKTSNPNSPEEISPQKIVENPSPIQNQSENLPLVQKLPIVPPSPVKKTNLTPNQKNDMKGQGDKEFFIQCSGMSLWELAAEVSSCFNVNILVFEDIKDKQIFGDIHGVSLKNILDAISWYCGVEYVEKDGIYYIGSNTKTIIVLPSSGLPDKIENIFQDVQVRRVNDKLTIYGSERDVARVKSVYDDLVKQHYSVVRFHAVEIQFDKNITFGLDLEKSVKYAFSWDNILKNGYNPIQSLAVSLYASLEMDSDSLRVNSLVDTDIGLLSGEKIRLQLGQDEDRPVYSQNSESGNLVISGYSTQSTGLLLELVASYDGSDWILDFNIENSEAKSSLVKTLTKLTSKSRLSPKNPVAFLCNLNLSSIRESYTKGVPLLADIPFLGYLFKVTSDREYSRKVYFIATLHHSSFVSSPKSRKFSSPLLESSRFLQNLPEMLFKASQD